MFIEVFRKALAVGNIKEMEGVMQGRPHRRQPLPRRDFCRVHERQHQVRFDNTEEYRTSHSGRKQQGSKAANMLIGSEAEP